jgi:hypothetical protein
MDPEEKIRIILSCVLFVGAKKLKILFNNIRYRTKGTYILVALQNAHQPPPSLPPLSGLERR